jgi:hypothetical protein
VAWPAGGLERLLQVGDAGKHRGELLELVAGLVGQQARDGGLAGAGRAPEDHRGQPMRLGHAPDRPIGAEQVVLAHHLVERGRPQPIGQGRWRLGRQAGGFEEVRHGQKVSEMGLQAERANKSVIPAVAKRNAGAS